MLPVMFANACAPPIASSSISHSVLVEESIHTGESDIENAFANWEWRNPFDDFRLCNILFAPVLQYTLPCCCRKKKRHPENFSIVFYYTLLSKPKTTLLLQLDQNLPAQHHWWQRPVKNLFQISWFCPIKCPGPWSTSMLEMLFVHFLSLIHEHRRLFDIQVAPNHTAHIHWPAIVSFHW